MAVKTRDELLETVKNIIGESTDDISLSFIEDITDTIDEYEKRLGEDWKSKYEENDKVWRKKYKERFYSTNDGPPEPNNDREDKKTKFEELFTQEV